MFSTFWTIISIGAVLLVALWIVAAFLNNKFKGLVTLFNDLKAAVETIKDAIHKNTPPANTTGGATTTTDGTTGGSAGLPDGNIQKS